jgi:uncharacterized protein YbjT (DUF2867 family)
MRQLAICILGGSGFIGQEICRLAVAMGHRPTSVSRGGRPGGDEPWLEGVEWIAASVFEPQHWRGSLRGCEALVHCVGVDHEDDQQSFEHLHYDSALLAADEAEAAGVDKFVYLSAAAPPAPMPAEYLATKRRAEDALAGRPLDVAILRPTLVYGRSPEGDVCAGLMSHVADSEASLQHLLDASAGLRREKVAMAALRAALQPETTGSFDDAAINHLGDAMFIQ